MASYWITYTEKARRMFTPFRPNHSVPADRYVVDEDWLEFQADYQGAAQPVLRVRKVDVARIERIENWRADQRKERESAAYRLASQSLPRRIPVGDEDDGNASHPKRGPDFVRMRRQGLTVLDEGLPALPEELEYPITVPVSYWTTDTCGAVQFLFFQRENGDFAPADVTLQFSRDEDGWYPIRSHLAGGVNRTDAIGNPDFMVGPHSVIETSHSSVNTEPEPGDLAIVMSGRHAPEVAEIWLVQGGRVEKRPASGHFGSWTICTEAFEPLRVEAHDAKGALLGAVNEPLPVRAALAEQPLARVPVRGAERPHRHGGRVQIQEIERYAFKVVVKWVISLEPDPGIQLAEDLGAHGVGSKDPWSPERIEQHVKLIDVLKLSTCFSQLSLTDDLGTEYKGGGGGVSEHGVEFTKTSDFRPSIPASATVLTVHWEDLDFRIPLH